MDKALDAYVQASDVNYEPELDRPIGELLEATAQQAEPATPAAQPQNPAAQQPKNTHPDWLVEQAKHACFSQDEIDGMTSPELRRAIVEVRSFDSAPQRTAGGAAPQTAQAPAAGASPTVSAQANPQPGASSDGPRLDWGQNADDWIDPGFRDKLHEVAFKPILEELQELRAMKPEFEQMKQHFVAQATAQQANAIDKVFAKLNLPALGTGTLSESTAQQKRRRQAVVRDAAELAREGVDMVRAIEQVATEMFGGMGEAQPQQPTQTPTETQRRQQARDQGGRFQPTDYEAAQVQRPTNRKPGPAPKSHLDAAFSRYAALAQNGVAVEHDFDINGFPE